MRSENISELERIFGEEIYEDFCDTVISLMNKKSREDHRKKVKSLIESRTNTEEIIKEKVLKFEDQYFSDLRLIDIKGEMLSYIESNRSMTPEEVERFAKGEEIFTDDEFENVDNDYLTDLITLDDWEIVIVPDTDDYIACCDENNKVIEITESYKEDDSAILHEMIHAYEAILTWIGKNYKEYLLIYLYKDLVDKVENLEEYISFDSHDVTTVELHSILFTLKCLDLDLKLGVELGTVYGYNRRKYYNS